MSAFTGADVEIQPSIYTGQDNRDIDFRGKAITVRSSDPQDWDTVATTIIDCNGNETEPHRGFYFHRAEENKSVLKGLTIINGDIDNGGGIYCRNSSPSINNCIIKNNKATYGGGLKIEVGEHEEYKLTSIDTYIESRFGYSVAIDGNIAIVGAYGNYFGTAFLFDVTTGTQLAKLTALDTVHGHNFGDSVAIDGNIAIIGADNDDDAGLNSGSAYLFDVTTGAQLAKLTALDAAPGHYFGNSVAIDGNIAIVGANGSDSSGSFSGSSYLFDVTTGAQLAKLTALDAAEFDNFGISVAIDGNIAIVGASGDDDGGSLSGSAYLFDVTTGTQLAKLTALDAATWDTFGKSVAIDGGIAIVGAYGDDDNGNNSGSAYLFDVTTGTQLTKLTALDAASNHYFGELVAIDGNVAIVGAVGANDIAPESGSAYLFDVTTGTQLAKLIPSDVAEQDYFGGSVAISGDIAIVGASGDDDWGFNSGSAYLFNTVFKADASIDNCIITENIAQKGSGIFCYKSNSVFNNCLIKGNYAYGTSYGGGISTIDSNISITNSTITGNISELFGGGIDLGNSNMTVSNSILWENSALYGSAAYLWDESIFTTQYSDIQHGLDGIHAGLGSTVNWGSGNIDIDPLFVNEGYWDLGNWIDGDYNLQEDSLCIDAGDPNYITDVNDVDFNNNRRVYGGRIDIGAYEYQPEIILDFDSNGVVNLADFAILSSCWDHECVWPDWCQGVDTDESGKIDYYDLIAFSEKWLDEYPVVFYSESLDTDPRWDVTGEWAFGQPAGDGGSQYGNPDPTSGYTNTNVYGVNLNGDYAITIGGSYYLIAGPFDCSGYESVTLKFARWLNTDDPAYVTATIEVSDDGATWTTVWENGRGEIADTSWRMQEYDISSVADNQDTVYVRWGYEVLEHAYPYSGWNIDDIELWGNPY